MKKIFTIICYYLLKALLALRYRIHIKGLENLTPEHLDRKGGVLFLPNHPSQLDPLMVTLALQKTYPVRPVAIDYVYYTPGLTPFLKLVDTIPIPDFEKSVNSFKNWRKEQIFSEIAQGLKKKENFLVYPAARLKHTAKEIVGGSSGIQEILKNTPETNVVLVRISGLWGSLFSRAHKGKVTFIGSNMVQALLSMVKSLIFFMPKRNVYIEFVPVNKTLPPVDNRVQMNRFLENFYNNGYLSQDGTLEKTQGAETLTLVPYTFWSSKLPKVAEGKTVYQDVVDVSGVKPEVKQHVLEQLSELANVPVEDINLKDHLSSDLGLDSLAGAELVAFLEDFYYLRGVNPIDLTTVSRVIAIAGGKLKVATEELDTSPLAKWEKSFQRERPELAIPQGETLGEVFLRKCDEMGSCICSADPLGTVLSYKEIKLRVIAMAEEIKKMPGDQIGILLPSSHGAYILSYACFLARKTPVMINWTVGGRYMDSVFSVTGIQVVLSAWRFLDRAEGVDFAGYEDRILLLEDYAREISIFSKLKAKLLSMRSGESLIRYFGLHEEKSSKEAVILFTSGTESQPKGVPLTHGNILANLRAALSDLTLKKEDILLAFLPPFHSFGFSVTSIFPTIAGIRTVFCPNPTDGLAIAVAAKRFKATIICGAPTFLMGVLRAGKGDELDTVRLFVSGAEKLPKKLISMVKNLKGVRELVEGYGVTECSPAITFNRPGMPSIGVGRPLHNVELKIIHPETHEELPIGERGLILAAGPNVFSNYLNPGLSSPFIEKEGKKWYNTGDLGYLDEEGYLFISGRLKRFIKIGGEMISLEAIEKALLEAAPDKGWPIDEEVVSLAICSKESEKQAEIILVTTFDVDLYDVNKTLRECGFSNLVKIQRHVKVDEIPIMGTGKTHYRQLEQNL